MFAGGGFGAGGLEVALSKNGSGSDQGRETECDGIELAGFAGLVRHVCVP